jgi:hypothetical protein
MKGYPYDNAVAESTFKMIKVGFVYFRSIKGLTDLPPIFGPGAMLVNSKL